MRENKGRGRRRKERGRWRKEREAMGVERIERRKGEEKIGER